MTSNNPGDIHETTLKYLMKYALNPENFREQQVIPSTSIVFANSLGKPASTRSLH